MSKLSEMILKEAHKRAKTFIKVAKKKQRDELYSVSLKEKLKLETVTKKAIVEGNQQAEMEFTKILRKAKLDFLKSEQEVFEELRRILIHKLEINPKFLFSKILKEGKKQFKKASIESGKRFAGFLKGNKIKINQEIEGMRIGEKGVWLSADIPDFVNDFLDEHFSEIHRRLFGE